VYFGLDFSRATFNDPNFDPSDVVRQHIPNWNAGATPGVLDKLGREFDVALDDQAARLANTGVTPNAFGVYLTDNDRARRATTDEIESALQPRCSKDGPRLGLVLLVHFLTKREGVGAFGILFDRRACEMIAMSLAHKHDPEWGNVFSHYRESVRKAAMEAAWLMTRPQYLDMLAAYLTPI
jgi:hypothetical protein